jgi:hypothetical protein
MCDTDTADTPVGAGRFAAGTDRKVALIETC